MSAVSSVPRAPSPDLSDAGMIAAMLALIALRSSKAPLCVAPSLCRGIAVRSSLRMAPEGPEVSCLVDSLDERFGGNRYELQAVSFVSGRYANQSLASTQRVSDGFAALAEALPLPLKSVNCKGKFIWFDLGRGVSIWSTLGLTGSWRFDRSMDQAHAAKHDRTVLHLVSRETQLSEKLYYSDQRNFGTLKACHSEEELLAKLRSLGQDWLADDRPSFAQFLHAVRSTKRGQQAYVAKWLMEQKRFSGVGNYILSEALYRSRTFPFARFTDLSDSQLRRLYRAVLFVTHHSRASQDRRRLGSDAHAAPVEAGSALDAFDTESIIDLRAHFARYVGEKGSFRFAVYAQRHCPSGRPVRREEGPHGRALHWVEELQTEGAAVGTGVAQEQEP